MADRPDLVGGAVVFLGSFNPAIFHPSWFAAQNLITIADSEPVGVQITHPQISQFETESFVIQVTPDRFAASSKPSAPDILVRDLVIGTFYVLEHTPVTAMGINRHMHYRVESEAAWHQLDDRLTPKDAWNAVLGGRPGMLSLEILGGRTDDDAVPTRVKVQPSNKVKPFGVYFETDEHYVAPKDNALRGLIEILRERYEDAQEYAGRIADHVIDWAREPSRIE